MYTRFYSGKRRWLKTLTVVALMPGFHHVLGLRIQRLLGAVPIVGKLLRRLHWFIHSIVFGSEVSLGTQIASGFHTPHPYGIIIADGVRIGQNVSILQGVTIGIRNRGQKEAASIGDGVMLSANCSIIGPVVIGANAIVGANAVVLNDVPAGALAVGNPARIIPDGATA